MFEDFIDYGSFDWSSVADAGASSGFDWSSIAADWTPDLTNIALPDIPIPAPDVALPDIPIPADAGAVPDLSSTVLAPGGFSLPAGTSNLITQFLQQWMKAPAKPGTPTAPQTQAQYPAGTVRLPNGNMMLPNKQIVAGPVTQIPIRADAGMVPDLTKGATPWIIGGIAIALLAAR